MVRQVRGSRREWLACGVALAALAGALVAAERWWRRELGVQERRGHYLDMMDFYASRRLGDHRIVWSRPAHGSRYRFEGQDKYGNYIALSTLYSRIYESEKNRFRDAAADRWREPAPEDPRLAELSRDRSPRTGVYVKHRRWGRFDGPWVEVPWLSPAETRAWLDRELK